MSLTFGQSLFRAHKPRKYEEDVYTQKMEDNKCKLQKRFPWFMITLPWSHERAFHPCHQFLITIGLFVISYPELWWSPAPNLITIRTCSLWTGNEGHVYIMVRFHAAEEFSSMYASFCDLHRCLSLRHKPQNASVICSCSEALFEVYMIARDGRWLPQSSHGLRWISVSFGLRASVFSREGLLHAEQGRISIDHWSWCCVSAHLLTRIIFKKYTKPFGENSGRRKAWTMDNDHDDGYDIVPDKSFYCFCFSHYPALNWSLLSTTPPTEYYARHVTIEMLNMEFVLTCVSRKSSVWK